MLIILFPVASNREKACSILLHRNIIPFTNYMNTIVNRSTKESLHSDYTSIWERENKLKQNEGIHQKACWKTSYRYFQLKSIQSFLQNKIHSIHSTLEKLTE